MNRKRKTIEYTITYNSYLIKNKMNNIKNEK